MITKEGDFGLSIYEIISGKVGIFVDSSGTEIKVATLGPGMIIGEMSFLTGTSSPRSASARALEDCCLEAWHPNMITAAYKQMPTILGLIAGQSLKSLSRMNKMVSGYHSKKRQDEIEQIQESSERWSTRRSFYRKEFDKECVYRPVNSPKSLKLIGRIKNISRGGMQMVAKTSNSR
ncbi:MAG: cyclic nucleotide-binding domain-containing protein [Deltaproteobacteria bacterium]|nr:cyclic nucleotide-binding domain-containing protein [Deltaproteobacteria bacterium]